MRKSVVLLFLLMLLGTLTIGTVHAAPPADTPTSDLVALAQYYPSTTPLFAAIRTDDVLFEKLDAVFARLKNNLGGVLPIPPEVTVKNLVDMFVSQIFMRPYDETFAWLGDSAAIGVTSFDALFATAYYVPDPPVLFAAEVADKDAALRFVDNLFVMMMGTPLQPEVMDGWAFYTIDRDAALVVGDDVLLFSNDLDLLRQIIAGKVDGTLAESAQFSDTLALLPGSDYDILFYEDAGGMIAPMMTSLRAELEAEGTPEFAMLDTLEQLTTDTAVVIGFASLNGHALIMDVASRANPEALGMSPAIQTPVNLEFAQYVPADAPFVILDNGFGTDMLEMFAMLDMIGPLLQAEIEMFLGLFQTMMETEMPATDPTEALILEMISGLDLSMVKFGGLLKHGLTPWVAGMTGLNLEDDILEWMTGDYAAYLRILPLSVDPGLTLDLNFTTAAADPDKAAYIVQRLGEVSGMYNLEYASETIGTGEAVVWPYLVASAFPANMREGAMQASELALVVASDGDVFSAGTRPGVEFALNPGKYNITQSPVFVYTSQNLFLPDATSIAYINMQPLVTASINLQYVLGQENAQTVAYVLAQIESLSISVAMPEPGVGQVRFTLSLPEAVNIAPPGQ